MTLPDDDSPLEEKLDRPHEPSAPTARGSRSQRRPLAKERFLEHATPGATEARVDAPHLDESALTPDAKRPGVWRAILFGLAVLVACLGASLTLALWVESGPRPDEEVARSGRAATRRSPRVLAGSGSCLPLTRRLLERFREHGGRDLRLEMDSVGSGGGLRALRDDVIDGALVSRAPRPGELEGARAIVYARTEVVLATTTRRASWSREQVLAAFRGEDTQVVPLLRELGDSGVAAMRDVWPELSARHDEAVRARRFEVLYTDEAMARALAEVNDAIGLFDRGQLALRRSPASALELASAPKELALVVRGDRLDDFVAFLSSDEARALIRASGYEVP